MNPEAIPLAAGDPSPILWVFFWIAMVITAVFAFALLYHWFRYGYMYPVVFVMMPIYAIGTLILIGAMLGGIAAA